MHKYPILLDKMAAWKLLSTLYQTQLAGTQVISRDI